MKNGNMVSSSSLCLSVALTIAVLPLLTEKNSLILSLYSMSFDPLLRKFFAPTPPLELSFFFLYYIV